MIPAPEETTMCRRPMYLIAALLLLLSPIRLLPQAPGQRGPAGPAAPANIAFHNERNDMRHQGFVDIAKKGNIDLLFVGDSITDWFYWPRGNGEATGGKVWEANFTPLKPANFAIAAIVPSLS